MEFSKDEALLVVILVSYYFHNQGFIVENTPTAEGLDEVKLLRKIAREFPTLESHVDLAIKGE